jgi:hypothetical protein
MKTLATLALTLVATGLLSLQARAQSTGTTTNGDLPSLSAAFVIQNNNGVPISYQVQWGNQGWKSYTLQSGFTTTHTFPLNNGMAPIPNIQFGNAVGGTAVKTYRLNFGTVGDAGFGPARNDDPWRYNFRYAGNGRSLDLYQGLSQGQ